MNKLLIGLIFMVLATNNLASTIILKQGKVIVSMDDIDGFSMTIPKEKRHGYFDSPSRIEFILTNVLKIKHFLNYAEEIGIKYPDKIEEQVKLKLIEINNKTNMTASSMEDERLLQLLGDYIELGEKYKYLKTIFKKNVLSENTEELAKEEYMINASLYSESQSKDIGYISLPYKKENKKEVKMRAEEILKNVSKIDFEVYINKNLKTQTKIEHSIKITNFKFSKKYKEVSNFIFKDIKLGLIEDILDYNSRFNIFYVYEYYPEKILPFEEVKDKIIEQLDKSKLERYFINLYSSITQDEVDINEEAVSSLRDRYLVK